MMIRRPLGLLLTGAGLLLDAAAFWLRASAPSQSLWLGFVGTVLFAIGALAAFIQTDDKVDENGHPITPWYFLLSEPHGGYSLGRMQLVIWFLPAFAMYVALSIAAGSLVNLNATFIQLLGLSAGTTMLAGAATPKPVRHRRKPGGGDRKWSNHDVVEQILKAYHAAATSRMQGGAHDESVDPALFTDVLVKLAPALQVETVGAVQSVQQPIRPPNLRDLVEDFDEHGDITRYQYLLVAGAVVAMLVMEFFETAALPKLDQQQLLYLVGVSQATYLGAKGVKSLRSV